jgi:hypothetical protein
MQGINGKWGRRGVWQRVLASWYFRVSIGLEMLRKDKTSSEELVSCISRWVDTRNGRKVLYEGGMAEVSALSRLCISIRPGMVTERQNELKRTSFVDLEAG